MDNVCKKSISQKMKQYGILVHNGYALEFDCEITAESAMAARKEWFRRNSMQSWRTIKATKNF